ncbi:MAG: AraC family transcriptional regulator [Steroidobacteraceae bacterium]
MLYVVLHRLTSVAEAWSPGARVRRLASLALLLTCSWVAAPAVMAQGAAAPAADPAPPPAAAAPASAPVAGADAAAEATSPAPIADTPGSEAGTPPDTRGLDQEVQGLKKDVVDLNRELFVLEEELLFPANTQVAVFVSMDVGDFFALDTVTLKIDQKEVINYLYTPREVEALLKGGVHRLYLGNLKVGKHELVAFFSGKGPNDRDYKRGATLKFEKGIGAKYLELKINDRQRRQQPEFEIKDWE